MSLKAEENITLVKIKDEPPDNNEDHLIIDCNPWEIKQEPEENFDIQLKTQPVIKKLVIFPKEYEKKTPFHCRLCGKRFSDVNQLKSHASIHERTKKCEICNARVLSKALNLHIRTEHRNNEVFKCPKCYASFKMESNLQQHIKRHEMKFVFRIEK